MDRKYYLDLAASGLCMPVGTDLVLHENPDVQGILRDGERLGRVFEEAAHRYHAPMAYPIMDLTLEKASLLRLLDVPEDKQEAFQFTQCPGESAIATFERRLHDPLDERLQAVVDGIRYIARNTKLLPVGLVIGPFSLMTKLVADPITALYMAASGVSAEEDPDVKLVETSLELATRMILRSVGRQIEAGAKAILVAEPAPNIAFLSPNQIEAGSDIFDRYVMRYNFRLRELLRANDVDLIFHCCGELIDYMVSKFNTLDAAMLSLGSSRKLWEDARLISKQTVLYGNLPSKKFYSDDLMSVEGVRRMCRELKEKMRACGHPFILGTECDVLNVKGCEKAIREKVAAMVEGRY